MSQDNKELLKKITEVLEEYGKVDISSNEASFEFWTDTAGQDVVTEIDFDGTANDFVEKFKEKAECYDVDEEVELYAGHRGSNGVPNTIVELLADCTEAKNTLLKIAGMLERVLEGKSAELDSDDYKALTIRVEIHDGTPIEAFEEAFKNGINGIECMYEITEDED